MLSRWGFTFDISLLILDIAREQSLNLIEVEPLNEGILKQIFTNGLEYLESANMPTYLLKDLKEWESDLPTELKSIRWETDSQASPVHLSKTKLVSSDQYSGNFTASITKNEGEMMKTLYEEESCLNRRKIESCTNLNSSCLWFNKQKMCKTDSKKHIKTPYYFPGPKQTHKDVGDSESLTLEDFFSAGK